MGLSMRDKAIIRDINRFRVMDRDSIAELYFADKKRPINSANAVLKRLVTEGHIRRSTAWGTPYLYLSAESSVKTNSAKIPHYLEILRAYKEICAFGKPEIFTVEPKYAKGLAEPDAFFIWRKTPFFLECQRTFYSQKQIDAKFKRYKALYDSGVIFNETWQPADRKVFPYILVLSESRWSINGDFPFKVVQAQSFWQFVESLKPPQPKPKPQSGGLVVDLRK
jgi:hypothetical protein